MKFLKNLFGILGALVSIWGLFVILDGLGSRSEGAMVDPAGFRVMFGYIILTPGLIMLGIGWLIGRVVSKQKDDKFTKKEFEQSGEFHISKEEFSKLTYRQKFVVTEYGYLLSPEDAEIVGKMLGNFQGKEVPSFCETNGEKVSSFEQ